MIVVLAGTGKTTVATQLAAHAAMEGRSVCLVDASARRHAARWVSRRLSYPNAARIDVQLVRGPLGRALETLARRYDEVIVDPADDSQELRTALLAADRVLVPFVPSQFSLEAASDFHDDLVVAADGNRRLLAMAFANMAETNWTRAFRARDALTWLSEACPTLVASPAVLSYRPAALRESEETGLSVLERTSVSAMKAADQVAEVADELARLEPPATTIDPEEETQHDVRQQEAG